MDMSWDDILPLPVEEWIQQPQVIAGLVMAAVTPLAVPALIFGEVCLNSFSTHGLHKDATYNQELLRTTGLLWEGSCIFLLVYGCVRYTTIGAMLAVLVYSVVRSLVIIGVTLRRAKKRLATQEVNDSPLEPVSVYTDIEAGTFLKCLSVFVLQMLLYALLLRWVASESFSENDVTDEEVFRYAAGSVVATVQRVMSQGFRSGELDSFWLTYFYSPAEYRKSYHYPWSRIVMSWIVNDVLFTSIFLLLPLVTMGSDNDMEFVKDCTAVLFISQFDGFEADLGPGHFLHPEKKEHVSVSAELAAVNDAADPAVEKEPPEQHKPVQVDHDKAATTHSM